MGEKTGHYVQCRGCTSGEFVPLQIKGGKERRFYYTHPRAMPNGCQHFEQFDPDIDNVDDLKAMVGGGGLVLRPASDFERKAAPERPIEEPSKEASSEPSEPIETGSKGKVPDFGHGPIEEKPKSDPLKKPEPVEPASKEPDEGEPKEKEAGNEFALPGW